MNSLIKLSIKIENKKPIELNQLTLSLNALACQYDSFLRKSNDFDYHKLERKLYISKLEGGSLYAELVPAVIPLLNEFNTILTFGSYLKSCYEYFLGIKSVLDYKLTKTDCNELAEIINQTAGDMGSKLKLEVNGNINQINIINYNSIEASAAQNGIRKHLERAEDIPRNYSKELMYWANASFLKAQSNNKPLGDKVIIEKIDKKPKKVIFVNSEDKTAAMSPNSAFPGKAWQDLSYIVDVEVSYIEDTPQEYKITKLYKEETFDPYE